MMLDSALWTERRLFSAAKPRGQWEGTVGRGMNVRDKWKGGDISCECKKTQRPPPSAPAWISDLGCILVRGV